MMDELQLKLCDIQGRLFELSAEKGLPSAAFIKAFMSSETARELDSSYNRMQWMGEEYLLEEVCAVAGGALSGKHSHESGILRKQRSDPFAGIFGRDPRVFAV